MNTRELKKQLSQIETQLAEIVGDHKIDTPKRLRSFLFEVLQLPSEGLLSTKGGVSVSIKELKKIENTHPFVPLLIKYQELSKEYEKLQKIKSERAELGKAKEKESEVREEIEVLEEVPSVTILEVIKKDEEVLDEIADKIESLEELQHEVLTDSKLHIIIKGEYQRMAFLIGLIVLVGGFFFYAQYNYSTHFVNSVANVSTSVEERQ